MSTDEQQVVKGYVRDAGGGVVTIVVDRDTESYPPIGAEVTMVVNGKIIGMSRDELRKYALSLQSLHDPLQQPDNVYNRCENCHYTRHPCDVHEMASAVLELLGEP